MSMIRKTRIAAWIGGWLLAFGLVLPSSTIDAKCRTAWVCCPSGCQKSATFYCAYGPSCTSNCLPDCGHPKCGHYFCEDHGNWLYRKCRCH